MWDEEAETKQNLRRWASVLRKFGKGADFVQSIASRALVVDRSGSGGEDVEDSLISQRGATDRIVAAFGPGFVDSPYIWDLEGEPAAG